jgi:hypothetical protein
MLTIASAEQTEHAFPWLGSIGTRGSLYGEDDMYKNSTPFDWACAGVPNMCETPK